jgi:transcriptional regulator with XRE-family HTH domain
VATQIRIEMAKQDGLRQSQLARRIGKTEQWLSVRLRGMQAIDLNDLELIARGLGVAVTALLPRDAGSTPPRGADTLQNRRPTERHLRSTERRHRSKSAGRPPERPERNRKPDTVRRDPRRPRILPRPAVGTA